MLRSLFELTAMAALAAAPLLADFSYQETTHITGGALLSAMKMAGVLSKQARQASEPIESTIALKGDRMLHRSPTHATVIDLGNETITSIDLQKRTYSVMTFDEMKRMMAEMSEKLNKGKDKEKDDVDWNFKISANRTGKSGQVAGLDATEMVLKMSMQGSDKQSGQQGSIVIAVDSWIAPKVAGYEEVREFHRRMAEKLNWTPNGGMFMSRPDVQRGMAEIEKESAKLDGVPVFQTTVMGGDGTAPVDRSALGVPPPAQTDKPSVTGALGSALGGRFGLGRKKQSQPPPEDNSSAASATLLEMTTELRGFSAGPVDAAQFEVPAGFKKVEAREHLSGR